MSAGDFVRWCRQVLDLLDQLRNAAPDPGCEQWRNVRSTPFGAASSLLMAGRVGQRYGEVSDRPLGQGKWRCRETERSDDERTHPSRRSGPRTRRPEPEQEQPATIRRRCMERDGSNRRPHPAAIPPPTSRRPPRRRPRPPYQPPATDYPAQSYPSSEQFGQQPGQYGQYGQPQYGQPQPDYGQSGQYGQPGQYGPYTSTATPPGPKRSKALIGWLAGGAAVILSRPRPCSAWCGRVGSSPPSSTSPRSERGDAHPDR